MILKIERKHLRKMCIKYDLFGVLRYFLYILVYLLHFLKYKCITLINRNKIVILITKNKNISNNYVASTELYF